MRAAVAGEVEIESDKMMQTGDVVEDSSSEIMICANCGVTAGGDIKLKKCNGCYLVKYCGVDRGSIDQYIKKRAKNGRPSYVMRFYSSNPKAVTMATARSVAIRYR